MAKCREHYQGDRCRLPLGHDSNLPEKDILHKGQFSNFSMATDEVEEIPAENFVTQQTTVEQAVEADKKADDSFNALLETVAQVEAAQQ